MKTVMITGAAGNLGRAVAPAFAAEGARLLLVDRHAEALQAAFGDQNAMRVFMPVDLLDAAAVNAAVAAAVERCGRIDVLCHVAGGFRMGEAVHETGDETWNLLFDLNLRTWLHVARGVVPHMLAAGGGRIIGVGALSSRQGLAQMGAYCASKDAMLRLAESMAAELGPKDIRVNCVLPSVIDTPENRAAMPGADASQWVAPADIAAAMVWLASDAARAVRGVGLPLTGGA